MKVFVTIVCTKVVITILQIFKTCMILLITAYPLHIRYYIGCNDFQLGCHICQLLRFALQFLFNNIFISQLY